MNTFFHGYILNQSKRILCIRVQAPIEMVAKVPLDSSKLVINVSVVGTLIPPSKCTPAILGWKFSHLRFAIWKIAGIWRRFSQMFWKNWYHILRNQTLRLILFCPKTIFCAKEACMGWILSNLLPTERLPMFPAFTLLFTVFAFFISFLFYSANLVQLKQVVFLDRSSRDKKSSKLQALYWTFHQTHVHGNTQSFIEFLLWRSCQFYNEVLLIEMTSLPCLETSVSVLLNLESLDFFIKFESRVESCKICLTYCVKIMLDSFWLKNRFVFEWRVADARDALLQIHIKLKYFFK